MIENDLIALYQQRLNLKDSTFSRIEHDDAMVATVYLITPLSGLPLILKVCSRKNDYLREVYFLEHFANKLPVPRIIQLVPPQADVHGAILMEYLPGSLLKITDFSHQLAYEMGALLAQIHLSRVNGYGDLIQPQTLSSDPRLHFTLKFEEGLEECSHHLPKSLIDKCRRYFDSNLHRLASIDGPCLIHRDFRAGNVIVFRGKIKGIIDWSSGRAGFAEEDFCPMEHGEWPSHPESKEFFLSGYASIRPVPDYKAIMPLLRLSRAIAAVGFTVKRGTWESSNASFYQFNRHFIENFF